MKQILSVGLQVLFFPFPWRVRRRMLVAIYGHQLHPDSRIGYSILLAKHVRLAAGARIGSLNVFKGLSQVEMDESSSIGSLNWITGFPIDNKRHFDLDEKRNPSLLLGEHSAITNRHLIDCTDQVTIGNFSTFAGFRSQILTHSISIHECRQRSGTVSIGDFCFVGTGCIFLPGARLPNYTVMSSLSLANKEFTENYTLIGGIPARKIKSLSTDEKYFIREIGFVE